MNTIIKGSGALTLLSPIPDDIAAGAYPYFITEMSPDGGFWLELAPYPEMYDETEIRRFLVNIKPYVKAGRIVCAASLMSDGQPVYHTVSWSFRFHDGHLFRDEYGTGSCARSSCID